MKQEPSAGKGTKHKNPKPEPPQRTIPKPTGPKPRRQKPAGQKPERPPPAQEIEGLQDKVRELEETLDAIRSGEVDAIVVAKGDDRQVYTLEGADQPYRILVENIREGVLTLAEDGSILYGNTQFGTMLRTPCRKILGSSFADHVSEEDRPLVAGLLADACAGPVKCRLSLCHTGGVLPVQVTLNPIVTGGHSRISAIITDRKEDEDRIRMHARMLDATGDAVIAADTEGKIIYWNDAATKTYGWKQNEVMGRSLISVLVPEPSQPEVRNIAARLLNGEKWTGRYVARHQDGHTFPIHANDAPLYDENGDLTAVISASYDITKIVEGEEELLRAHEQTAMVLESISDSFIALDRDWRFTYVNRRAYLPPHVRPEDIIGKTIWEIFPEITGTPLEAFYREAMAREEPMISENRSVVASGRTFELHTYPTSDHGLAIFGHDITDRKLMEEDLRKSEERFRVLLQHIQSVAIQGYAPDGTITYWNDASAQLYGYTAEEAMGKNLVDIIIPPEMRDEVRQAIAGMAESGEPIPAAELALMRKDGSRVPVLSSHGVVRASSGKTELFCIDIDLTERKLAEEALRKSEEEYRHVVEYAPASIYEISADGQRFIRVNDAMCRILGYSREELMAMSPSAILDEESRERFRERINKRSAGEDIDESVAYRIRAKDGRPRWVTLNIKLNHDRGDSTLVVAHDITERRQMEENLRESD